MLPERPLWALFFQEENMEHKSNEELIFLIYEENQSEDAFAQLIKNLTPMMIKIGREHLSKLHFYDIDDYV